MLRVSCTSHCSLDKPTRNACGPYPLSTGAFGGPPPHTLTSSISKPNLPAVLVCFSCSRDEGTQRTERKAQVFFLCIPALGMYISGHELLISSQCCSCFVKVGVANACKFLLALVLTTSVQVCSLHVPGEKHLTRSM